MSSAIVTTEKVEKSAQPEDNLDTKQQKTQDDVDAAPTRETVSSTKISQLSQQQKTHTDSRQARLAAEEDVADIEPRAPQIQHLTRELDHLSLKGKKRPQTATINNNNIIPEPTKPRSTYTQSKYVYNMHHEHRGKAIVINNANFHRSTGMPKRGGSDGDARGLFEVLEKLGFTVQAYTDLTIKKTRSVLKSISNQDHSQSDCMVLAIMSHGEEGVLYCTDGVIPVEELTSPFRGDRCPSLAGKPKIFFIQACRGQQLDGGVEIGREETDAAMGLPGEDTQIIPSEADFLVGYSSPPGYYSWRNQGDGAWFIQAIVRVLKEHGTELEIQQMMTRVNHIVAYEFISNCSLPGYDLKKQVPCIVSTLTKDLYFNDSA